MEEDIQNIGRFNYLWTIFTGKNRQVEKIERRVYSRDGYTDKAINGDFILTIGKRAIILTIYRNNRREPVIVRKWKKIQNSSIGKVMTTLGQLTNSSTKVETFIDSAGYRWEYYTDDKQWIVVYEPNNGELSYEIQIQ